MLLIKTKTLNSHQVQSCKSNKLSDPIKVLNKNFLQLGSSWFLHSFARRSDVHQPSQQHGLAQHRDCKLEQIQPLEPNSTTFYCRTNSTLVMASWIDVDVENEPKAQSLECYLRIYQRRSDKIILFWLTNATYSLKHSAPIAELTCVSNPSELTLLLTLITPKKMKLKPPIKKLLFYSYPEKWWCIEFVQQGSTI